MVVKIQPAAAGIGNALAYNEGKMTGEEAILDPEEVDAYRQNHTGHVVITKNVPTDTTLEDEFQRLIDKNRRNAARKTVENTTFHMSINPAVDDEPLTEAQIAEFAEELMNQLGYGNNPYRIYRHDDTGRTHYHVVSTRIGQDGKKIKDSYENTRCEKICRSLAQKYGYTYGLETTEEKTEEKQNSPEKESKTRRLPGTEDHPDRTDAPKRKESDGKASNNGKSKVFVPPFEPTSSIPASEQFKTFHQEAMKWYFSTPEQYAAILKWRYNTRVELYDDGIQYTGLGKTGSPCTVPITETELGTNSLNEILSKCSEADMKSRKAQKERLEKLAEWAAKETDTWDAFRKLMAKKGVYVVISWTEEGQPFGVTYLDRATRCAWKGSETQRDLSWLKEKAAEKGWMISRNRRFEKPIRTNDPKSRLKAKRTARPLHELSSLDALKRLMNKRGVGTKKIGTSGSGKNKSDIKYGDEDNKNDIII